MFDKPKSQKLINIKFVGCRNFVSLCSQTSGPKRQDEESGHLRLTE